MDLQTVSDLFRKYAGHKPNCNRLTMKPKECDCGFIQIMVSLPLNGNVECVTVDKDPEVKRETHSVIRDREIKLDTKPLLDIEGVLKDSRERYKANVERKKDTSKEE